jgi:DNA processing protein
MDDLECALLLGLNATLAAGAREVARLRSALGDLRDLEREGAVRRLAAQKWPGALLDAVARREIAARGARERELAVEHGVAFALHGSEGYPARLGTLANPPIAIFYRGSTPAPDRPAVAIVGSRTCTRYGARTTHVLAADLARAGVAVVSGLARGIDTEAHEGALEGATPTYAVMGSGHASIYPPENRRLAEAIAAAGGGVLSEFGPEVAPLAHNFPRRNRLLAALADAVVVVEARKKSGALITARWAADLGKEVFVLPGQIDNPACEGALALLRDGAAVIRGAEDLLSDMSWMSGPKGAPRAAAGLPASLAANECRVLALLDHEPQALDEVLARCTEAPGEVLTILLALELRGLIEQTPGLCFRRPTPA